MFSTSTDILNLVLAISIAVLTFFLCTALYYLISSIRKTQRIIKAAETIIVKTNDLINLAKDKIKNSSTYLVLLGELFKKGLEYFTSSRGHEEKREKDEKKVKAKKRK